MNRTKRIINEGGTIVIQSATEECKPSFILTDEVGDLTNYASEQNTTLIDMDGIPLKKKKFGPKKFRPEWMTFDIFKDWLRPHPNPERAICMVCDIVLNAGKSELEKHGAAKKHQKKMLEGRPLSDQSLSDQSFSEGSETGALDGQDIDKSIGAIESAFNFDTSYSVLQRTDVVNHMNPKLRKTQEIPTMTTKATVTKPAPAWKATAVVNGHVTRLDLNDYKGRYVILFFYPQDFSAICPTEILSLSDHISEFRALQTEVVACSVDSHLSHLAWARTPRSDGGLANPKIPLLADPTHSIAKDYGVWLPELGHTLRAHFIIDHKGIIRHMSVNETNVGRSIEELLRLVKALQHVDKTESGCPADWNPEEPTI